jgi:hypothetical protein
LLPYKYYYPVRKDTSLPIVVALTSNYVGGCCYHSCGTTTSERTAMMTVQMMMMTVWSAELCPRVEKVAPEWSSWRDRVVDSS